MDRLRSSQARASETVEETAARRDVERPQSSQARALETVEEMAARRDVERLRSSQARAAETVEETAARTEVQRLRSSQAQTAETQDLQRLYTIMTVRVNPIMQAAPSQRQIISISEARNQLLFHSQKIFVE